MGVPGEDGGPGVFHLCSYSISNVGGHADFCSVDLQTHTQTHIEIHTCPIPGMCKEGPHFASTTSVCGPRNGKTKKGVYMYILYVKINKYI